MTTLTVLGLVQELARIAAGLVLLYAAVWYGWVGVLALRRRR
jgi:hypothetical protein